MYLGEAHLGVFFRSICVFRITFAFIEGMLCFSLLRMYSFDWGPCSKGIFVLVLHSQSASLPPNSGLCVFHPQRPASFKRELHLTKPSFLPPLPTGREEYLHLFRSVINDNEVGRTDLGER